MQGLNTPISSLRQTHHRRNSGEIDVFDASRYFSTGLLDVRTNYEADQHRTLMRVNESKSVDMPIDATVVEMSHQIKEKIMKQCKQPPNTPTGRLANFFNSLLQYSSSKKKKSSSKFSVSGEESISGKKRSSSTSQSTRSEFKSSNYYSSSSCIGVSTGLRMPSVQSRNRRGSADERGISDQGLTVEESLRVKLRLGDELKLKKGMMKGFRGHEAEEDDGGESDSSSDLFELKNISDFGKIPSGLPVYGRTDIEVFRRRRSLIY